MTAPDTSEVEADAFVWNRVPAPPDGADLDGYRPGPPPATRGVLAEPDAAPRPDPGGWGFLWSPSGESVALLQDYEPVAMIHEGVGYSVALAVPCEWGQPWSDARFAQVFFP